MRKIVNLVIPKNGIIRLMIYDTGNETYLFGYKNINRKWLSNVTNS